MRYLYLTTVLLAFLCSSLSATLTEEHQGRLLQALSAMGIAPMTAESRELCDYVMQEELDIEARLSVFDQFFSNQAFTPHHGYNLDAHLQYSTADKEKMARFAGGFAASAISYAWRAAETTDIPSQPSLSFLESVFNKGTSEITEAFAAGIQDVLGNRPLNLVPFFNMETPRSPEIVIEAMQTCITLGVFSEKHDLAAWLKTPENTEAFFKRTRVWLFDGGVLKPEQLASLESLFSAAPYTLHGIIAVHVPEVTGFSANTPNLLRIPGLSVDIPPIDMTIMRDLSLYPLGIGMTPIPEFTAIVLERLAVAIQTRQFSLRPDLYERVKFFFSLMAARPAPMFEALFPADPAYQSPEQRMAYLGFYWLANSEVLLKEAINQAEQQLRTPIYALLLEADVCSELSDTTPLFRTSPAGILFAQKTALRRSTLTPEASYVNGIAVSGNLWQYEMSDMAGMSPGR